MNPGPFTIVGRSSSTFTRVTRIFAAELAVPYTFEIVRDLRSLDVRDYGGHPALKVPSLRTRDASCFGALNICRQLARASPRSLRISWPEALELPLLANMQELILQAMATEVGLIMSGVAEEPLDTFHRAKMSASLRNTLGWLDAHVEQALAALPEERDLSYLEVCLFCLLTHLDFRGVVPSAPYGALVVFAANFGRRASCEQTPYLFDA